MRIQYKHWVSEGIMWPLDGSHQTRRCCRIVQGVVLVNARCAINIVAGASRGVYCATSCVYKGILVVVDSMVVNEEFGHAHGMDTRGGMKWKIRDGNREPGTL